MPPPIFILGVPRSGTTLLRAILDSHSSIACGPETPWLCAHQPRSLMSLWQALRDEPWGYCASYNMPRDVPTAAARDFLSTLMSAYAAARGKKRWAEKTPDNALYVDFLIDLFPDARFIHLTRDGLDVAMSTSITAPHRKGISDFLESRIGFGPDAPAVPNTPFAALLRWRHWNTLIAKSLAGREHHKLSYERLVTEPEPTLRELMTFINEPFEPAMLDYARAKHDYPAWEWGSADVQVNQKITTARVGRAKRELPAAMYSTLSPLAHDTPIKPGSLTAADPDPPETSDLRTAINTFASALGLNPIPESQARPLAWLWTRGLARDWSNKTILIHGTIAHPLPWLLALQGANISIPGPSLPPSLESLARGLRINLSTTPPTQPPQAQLILSPSTQSPIPQLPATAPTFTLNQNTTSTAANIQAAISLS